MRILAVLIFLMLTSGCSAAFLCKNGLGCEGYLDELEIEWNKAIGAHKDELIKNNGAFDLCSPLTDGGEVCEWRGVQGLKNHKVIYVFDRDNLAQSWRYTGNYGSRQSKSN